MKWKLAKMRGDVVSLVWYCMEVGHTPAMWTAGKWMGA